MGWHRALTEGRAVASGPPRVVAHAAPKGPTGDAGGALTAQAVLQILQCHNEEFETMSRSVMCVRLFATGKPGLVNPSAAEMTDLASVALSAANAGLSATQWRRD